MSAGSRRNSGHAPQSRGCRAASGTSLLYRSRAPRDAMPRRRARRPSPISPRIRISRRMRVRGRCRREMPRARRQGYRRLRRRGFASLSSSIHLLYGAPVVDCLNASRLSSILGEDRVFRGGLLRRLPTRGRLRLGLLRPGGPSWRSGCHVRQLLYIRGLVHPARLAASAAAGKSDSHKRCGNPAPL